jgi:hypothetical protein
MFGFWMVRKLNALTSIFLITLVLTSVTGIGFSFDHLLPSPIIGSGPRRRLRSTIIYDCEIGEGQPCLPGQYPVRSTSAPKPFRS